MRWLAIMISEVLKDKRDKCLKHADEHVKEEHFFDAQYSRGQVKAYEDAILVMDNVNTVMSEDNLRRLLGRFLKDAHVGIVIANFRDNIRAGFEVVSSR